MALQDTTTQQIKVDIIIRKSKALIEFILDARRAQNAKLGELVYYKRVQNLLEEAQSACRVTCIDTALGKLTEVQILMAEVMRKFPINSSLCQRIQP